MVEAVQSGQAEWIELAMAVEKLSIASEITGRLTDRQEEVVAYNQLIKLGSTLNLEFEEYRNNIATACSNRGNTLLTLGNRDNLVRAITSYDLAIELRKTLNLKLEQFRNALASAYNSRGTALQALGNQDNLVKAIASYGRDA